MPRPRYGYVSVRRGGMVIEACEYLDCPGQWEVRWRGNPFLRYIELIVGDRPPVPVPSTGWAVITHGARVRVRGYYWPFDWPVVEAAVLLRPSAGGWGGTPKKATTE